MPYIDTVRVVHYNLKVPYICTQYVSFTTSQDEGLGQKYLVIKCSVKKVFLVIDRAEL